MLQFVSNHAQTWYVRVHRLFMSFFDNWSNGGVGGRSAIFKLPKGKQLEKEEKKFAVTMRGTYQSQSIDYTLCYQSITVDLSNELVLYCT